MEIECVICTALVKPSENIEATKCGHLYHDLCLAQWIVDSQTCPQCRQPLTEDCRFRIYPTVKNKEEYENITSLKSLLDDALLELELEKAATKELESKLKKITEEKESLVKENGELRTIPQQELASASSCSQQQSQPTAESQIRTPFGPVRSDFQNWMPAPFVPLSEPTFPPLSASTNVPRETSPLPFEELPVWLMNSGIELASNLSSANKSSSAKNSPSNSNSSRASGDTFACEHCGRDCGSRIGLYSHERSSLNKNLTNPQNDVANNSSSARKPSTANNNVFVCSNCGRICGSRIGLYSHEKSCLKNNSMNENPQINHASSSSSVNNSPSTSRPSSANNSSPARKSSSGNNSSPASEVFVCSNCGRICGSRIGLWSHEQSCLKKNSMYESPSVNRASNSPPTSNLSSANNSSSTRKSSSGNNASSANNSSSASDVFVCSNCGRICGSRIGLWSHENSCLKKNSMNETEQTSTSYYRPQEERPQRQNRSRTGDFPCYNCGRVCRSQIGLFSHQRKCLN